MPVKPIRLNRHSNSRSTLRGTSYSEIEETIQSEKWESAEQGRLECRRNFKFEKEWNGKFYKTKQVRPIFVEEEKEIVVITIYVYYF